MSCGYQDVQEPVGHVRFLSVLVVVVASETSGLFTGSTINIKQKRKPRKWTAHLFGFTLNPAGDSFGSQFEITAQKSSLPGTSVDVHHLSIVFNTLLYPILYFSDHYFMFKGKFPRVVTDIYAASAFGALWVSGVRSEG